MKKIKQHSVKYNFFMNFILSASQFIFPIITFPYISRVLLAEGSGKVTFATSIASYFLMVASLGIPTYGIRACAQVRNDKKKLSKTAQEILIINLVTTVLITIIYLISIFTISRFRADETLFLINGVNIVLNMFGMNWLFQALEQYDYITFRSLAFKIISIVLMFILVHEKSDYVIYGAITVFAAVGSNILNLIRSRHYIDFKLYENYNLRRHMKPILILFAQSLAISIYTNLDTVMLGFMKTDADVGYYNAAVKIKTILVSLVTSMGNVLLPRMSYYAKERKNKEFMNTMQMALNFTMLISIPMAVYFCMFSAESIRFLAGNGYDGAILAMEIITISIIPIGLTGILGIQVLTAIEKEKYVLYSVTTGAVIDFILNCLLIPEMGAAGAALATVIAEFVVLFVQVIYTKNLLKQVSSKLRGHIYIVLTIPSIILAYIIKCIDLKSCFISLVLSAIVFLGSYGIGLLFTKDNLAMEFCEGLIGKIKNKKGEKNNV